MSRFALTDDEAKARYKEYKSKDPFPNIEPALLNSADIEDYVAVTGMIFPFDSEKLISASYEVCLDGKVFSWNIKGDDIVIDIEEKGGFTLEKNSIAFVNLQTKFRIPDYIALRFNLIIKHVHRGILLGTGPLVDPGFEGNLLIPLHNLTANEYRFSAGEGLIWVEFTKVSKNQRWFDKNINLERFGQYRVFPDEKKNRDPKYYFEKAAEGRPIRSSIPDVIQDAKIEAQKAREGAEASARNAESMNRRVTIIGLIAFFALAIALATLVCTVYQSFTGVTSLITDTRTNLESMRSVVDERIKSQNEEVKTLRTEIQTLKGELEKFSKRPKELQPLLPVTPEHKK